MAYFSMFPNIVYDAKGTGKLTTHKNIFRRVKIKSVNQITGFDYYDVKDGEAPEIIASQYYDDPQLHWTILVANDIIDYYNDWPKSMQSFEQYVKDKYENPNAVHHYEITATSGDTSTVIDVGLNTTDYSGVGVTAVSNYQYELKLNEEKSKIRLIQKRYIDDFVTEFETKIKEGA